MADRIAFIGGGNMGRALLGGLLKRGYATNRLIVAEPVLELRTALTRDFGIAVTADNAAAVQGAQVVLLAVKPQQMKEVITGLRTTLCAARPLLVSIAAGIPTQSFAHWLGADLPLVRTMPNTPALIGRGITALFATPATPATLREIAEDMLRAAGATLWVADEAALDVVTAVSGSGPAYFFLLIECLEKAGIELGLPAATARRLALDTAAGAAELAHHSTLEPAALRAQVTSKGGTTAAALQTFEAGGFSGLVQQAVTAAARRAEELSREFGSA